MYIGRSHTGEGYRAKGASLLLKSDIEKELSEEERTDPSKGRLELDEDIQEVEEGVLALLPFVREIEISKNVKKIGVNEEDLQVMKKNNTLIRAEFDSYGEKFAREHQLRFLHTNIELARDGDYFKTYGIDVITLQFDPSGKVRIEQSNYCQGISASSSGGGDLYIDLRKDFYRTKSQEEIAQMVWGNCYEGVLHNAALNRFLNKAIKKKGYYLDFDPAHAVKKKK